MLRKPLNDGSCIDLQLDSEMSRDVKTFRDGTIVHNGTRDARDLRKQRTALQECF